MSRSRPALRIVLVALLVATGALGESRAAQEAQEGTPVAAPTHPGLHDGPPQQEGPAAATARTLGLEETVRLARRRSPLVRAKELGVDAAELDVRRVEDILQLPEIELDGRTGLVPEARGTIFDSPDSQNDLDGLGPFIQLDVGLTMPVFGWGRLGNLRAAARSGRNARAAQRDATADELGVRVSRAYWGLVAATAALEVAGDLRDEYEQILDQVEDKLAADEIDDTDAFEVQSLRYDIEQTWQDAAVDRDRAHAALVELLALDAD
ncbi:MAG: TolC family protein, partial [Acidobacteriota bacterium]